MVTYFLETEQALAIRPLPEPGPASRQPARPITRDGCGRNCANCALHKTCRATRRGTRAITEMEKA